MLPSSSDHPPVSVPLCSACCFSFITHPVSSIASFRSLLPPTFFHLLLTLIIAIPLADLSLNVFVQSTFLIGAALILATASRSLHQFTSTRLRRPITSTTCLNKKLSIQSPGAGLVSAHSLGTKALIEHRLVRKVLCPHSSRKSRPDKKRTC